MLNKIYKIVSFLFLFSVSNIYSQSLHGIIKEFDNQKKLVPLPGANVRWLGTTIGAITDINGEFMLEKIKSGELMLVVSYIGYKTDTINIPESQNHIDIILTSNAELKEVVINADMKGAYISKIKPIYTTVITGAGLQKAACCNLSESFQNSATVDVNYSDAVTGAKQIQMLGLAGIYSQILFENIPSIRGLATTYGLGYIPGPWMESIQVSKGTSSVINGYESITGQINVDYKSPSDTKEKLFVNVFGNSMGRTEGNMNVRIKLNKKLSTLFLIHGELQQMKIDANHDSFLDVPLLKQVNFMNRWNYVVPGKYVSKFGFDILQEDRSGGQENFNKANDFGTTNAYGIGVNTKRYQAFAKNGFLFASHPERSIGTIASATHHEQNSFFGLNKYDGTENNIYVNLIYADIIGNTNHKINAGLSYMYDGYKENVNDSSFTKNESVPGVFAEYTYDYLDVFTAMAGIRADQNNLYGTFITPRLHLKYNVDEKTTIRGSAGKGYRVANVFSENSALLASSRKLVFTENLKPEQAWNYGINIARQIKISKSDASLSLDFYRTDFINQVIIDLDHNSQQAIFYNLKGPSYSNSAQAEFTMQPIKRFDFTAAFRYNDVKTTIDNKLDIKPFVSKYKGLIALSYSTNLNKWKFDFTSQFNGNSRIPDTQNNPEQYRLPSESPAYVLLYAQVTKKYKDWDFYVGSENITNVTQKNPILAANDPFGSHFDTSMIWGPIVGRMFYAGIRYKLTD